MDPNLYVKLDGRQEGRNKEKSGCALAAYCHRPPAALPALGRATSGVGYLCRVTPSGSQSYQDHCSTLTLLLPSPGLRRYRVRWPYCGSVVLSTYVSDVAHVWPCIVSPLSLVCGICPPASAVTVRPVSLMTLHLKWNHVIHALVGHH